jgi:hypothetical protein
MMPVERALSVGQQALWLQGKVAPNSAAYHGVTALWVHAQLNEPVLAESVSAAVARHGMMRSTFVEGPDGPVRLEHPDWALPIEHRYLSDADAAAARSIVGEFSLRRFDLESAPAFRFLAVRMGDNQFVLAVVAHHIVTDATSQWLILRDVLKVYALRSVGRDGALVPTQLTFDDYVAQERAMLEQGDDAPSAQFWRQLCSPLPPSAELATDHSRPSRSDQAHASFQILLPEAVAKRTEGMARQASVTMFAYMFSVFQVLLFRRTRMRDFCIGYTSSTRTRSGLRNIVGLLANTPPFRARIDHDSRLADVMRATSEQIREALPHLSYPYGMLPFLLRTPRQSDRPALFQIMFCFLAGQHMDLMDMRFDPGVPSAEIAGLSVSAFPTNRLWLGDYDITVEVMHMKTGIQIMMMYRRTLYDRGTIEKLGQDYMQLLQCIEPESLIGRIGQ